VTEEHSREIELVLLDIAAARKRAERVARALRKEGADEHLVQALEEAQKEIDRVSLRLMQQTYFAVPKEQLP
jgi:DNA-binding FrmR family transcriptional regulator